MMLGMLAQANTSRAADSDLHPQDTLPIVYPDGDNVLPDVNVVIPEADEYGDYPLEESDVLTDEEWDTEQDVFVDPLMGGLTPDFVTDLPERPKAISDADWARIVDGRTYTSEVPTPAPEFGDRNPFAIGDGLANAMSLLAWVLVVVLILAALGYLVYNQRKQGDLVPQRKDFGVTDELLAASREDLGLALDRELADANYRDAIRFRFGEVLQELRAARLLKWVPGYTNADYAAQLPQEFEGGFGVLAKAFAFAFYGGREVSHASYLQFAEQAEQYVASFKQPAGRQSFGR